MIALLTIFLFSKLQHFKMTKEMKKKEDKQCIYNFCYSDIMKIIIAAFLFLSHGTFALYWVKFPQVSVLFAVRVYLFYFVFFYDTYDWWILPNNYLILNMNKTFTKIWFKYLKCLFSFQMLLSLFSKSIVSYPFR